MTGMWDEPCRREKVGRKTDQVTSRGCGVKMLKRKGTEASPGGRRGGPESRREMNQEKPTTRTHTHSQTRRMGLVFKEHPY